MRRKRKTEIKVNSDTSLEALMQETYSDACLQINDAQRTINDLVNNTNNNTTNDVDDLTKIAKEKSGLLKVKDSAIRIKLELAKLQNEIIKNKGDNDKDLDKKGSNGASVSDFKTLREMLKGKTNNFDDDDSE